MVLHKIKIILTIFIIFLLVSSFSSINSVRADSVNIDYTTNAQTIFDIEDYYCRLQDTYINFIYKENLGLFNVIRDNFNNNHLFYYITVSSDLTKNDHYNFKIYFYDIGLPNNLQYAFNNNLVFNDPFILNNTNQIGSLYRIRQYIYNNRIEYTFSVNDSINSWEYVSSGNITIPVCLIGRVSDYFLKLIDGGSSGGSSSNDYSNILYNMQSDLSSLLYNSNSIMSDISNVKNYTNSINNKLSTTNTYLSNIQGAINNGSSTITNTIVSTHNLDNSNDNKNTNEIINAINDNTNSINSLKITNDNSDLINAINNGFSNLNSNNNSNKNEIVSAINNAGQEIVDGQNDNTNSIIFSDNSNKNDIVEAIENNSSTVGSGGITNSEFNQGVSSINDNNNANTNRILADTVTEDSSNIFNKVSPNTPNDPLPDLSSNLTNFSSLLQTGINSNNDTYNKKTFILPIHNKNYTVTLDYNILKNKLFRVNLPNNTINSTLFNLWQALWWFLVGMFIFRKCKRVYNELVSGEWDEIMTKTDIHDDIIDGSVK